MRIRLLGPVELRAGADGFASLPGAQRRAILALLALRLGRVVAVEGFCELLWGDRPPASARAALQGHVAALRKAIAATPFVLHTRASGYLLAGPADEVDALCFEALTGRADELAGRGCDAGAAEAVTLLEQALRLWRGAALADLPDTALRGSVVDELEQAHTAALISWAGLRLRQGTGAGAVPALEHGVRADGLREEVVALLVRCLHQAGRRADALTVYHQARLRLAEELGIRPGPALQAALAEVLAGDEAVPAPPSPASVPGPARPPAPTPEPPPTARTPRQLPRRQVDFTGRAAEAQWLDRECGARRGADGPRSGERAGDGLALVVGPAGVGKSALVAAWAHRAAADFPDGQLYADLRGLDPAGPAEPAAVLGRFLHALGVPADATPADLAGRAALYRERTSGRRLLVVLDDAADADQVADLLPDGPDCAAVVTSRGSLEGLVAADGAALLRLSPLPAADARRLLERALTPERVRAEPAAADRLAELCDHLPLALRIAAARLATQPDWRIADLVAELAEEPTRLAVLDADGETGITAELALTFRQLSATARDLLALLAVHPGREVDTLASAALLGADLATARQALGELAAHHLLTGAAPGRYGRSELIRLFSADLLADLPKVRQRRAGERLLDYYQAALRHGGDFVEPGQNGFGGPAPQPPALPPAGSIRTALDWFQTEEPVIRALVTAAVADDPDRAWRLALAAGPLYYGSSRFTDWLTCMRLGGQAAEASGDRLAAARLHCAEAGALLGLERRQEAAEAARRAVACSEPAEPTELAEPADPTAPNAAGDDTTEARSARAQALSVLALVTALLGDAVEAVRLAATATELAAESGDPSRLARALAHHAWVSLAAGDRDDALRRAREVRNLLPARPVTSVHLWSMLTEAHALPPLGRGIPADLAWNRLLASCEEAGGVLYLHAIAEQSYASYLLTSGREPEARERLRSALERFRAHDRLAGFVSEFTTVLEESVNSRETHSI
ncbi:AfsR/SARP family transcriptional regulator [Kitasatospora sp. NPDC097643]|uniref:AfsR/SARP family transcriptional regulator n=1 Tax=Kitasatospora sp. NPDC097643 TaxID=3157230 RepID=UPI00332B9BF5